VEMVHNNLYRIPLVSYVQQILLIGIRAREDLKSMRNFWIRVSMDYMK